MQPSNSVNLSEIAWFRQLTYSALECTTMRWALVTLQSIASGVLLVLASIVFLAIALYLYGRFVLGIGPHQAIGWDLASLFGPHWKLTLLSIPVIIFGVGFSIGFWFFSRRLAH